LVTVNTDRINESFNYEMKHTPSSTKYELYMNYMQHGMGPKF